MSYLPITVIITLTSSLFVAMVINPALAAIFLKLPFGHPFEGNRLRRKISKRPGRRQLRSGVPSSRGIAGF